MISDLRLQNFRSYSDDSFEFSGAVNIVVGPNASGKTSLIEALLVCCRGNSYKGRDAEMIKHESPWSRLDAHTDAGVRTVKLTREADEKPIKTLDVDGKTYRRIPATKMLPVVLFEPDHLRLFSGSPESRREFIDTILEQVEPGYGTLLREYKRTLAQRNALLKQGPNTSPQLFAWNIRLSESAERVALARHRITEDVNSKLTETYQALSRDASNAGVQYKTPFHIASYGSQLLKKLEECTDIDYIRGFTTQGPHRDDLLFTINDRLATEVASRGETRTLLLSLKILELKILEDATGHKPVLLLDDVFSELDGQRRKTLTDFLKNYQTFITTTDADVVIKHFMGKCQIIAL